MVNKDIRHFLVKLMRSAYQEASVIIFCFFFIVFSLKIELIKPKKEE